MNKFQRIIAHHQQHLQQQQQQQRRPISAPVQRFTAPQCSSQRMRQCLPSEQSSLESSRNSSPVSVASQSSDASSSVVEIAEDHRPEFVSNSPRNSDDDAESEDTLNEKTFWPHSLSRPICCLFCTLGLFNISRFAIFTVHFGGNLI